MPKNCKDTEVQTDPMTEMNEDEKLVGRFSSLICQKLNKREAKFELKKDAIVKLQHDQNSQALLERLTQLIKDSHGDLISGLRDELNDESQQ